ncbi:dicarboxylate/amino acid:cation symporter [Paenactinomyces guangxiensis]|uniref:Dicarboxylate/amino acid:cation symporter n=1 Tax=Paenactinomyces guangxiensis TaxID=1490290 RepID=A0A7W2A9S8_9BACL|nr:dicarboxylate/amino acid:cation symporter [Paenactinomyces guangxiensis]MBA4495527.1 dicarboxylate/amino acid:cation symporter [Paenactinomyces guangxiensis]MBH8592785.1 dicarboxylate/amino acid:cation symporter [Paenactinomyces guangxiensis]
MKKLSLTAKILIGIILGLIVGVVLNLYFPNVFKPLNEYLFDPASQLFIKAIKMIVVPLVFFSLASGAAGIADPKKLGRIGVKTIVLYLFTTAVAITFALILANVIQPGVGTDIAKSAEKPEIEKAPSVMDTLVNIVPENPVQAMANADMLQIIFFALLFGIGMALLKDKVVRVREFIDQGNEIMLKLVTIIMATAPYAAFALMARAVGEAGIDLIGSMAWYMVTLLLALLIHMLVTYSTLLTVLAKYNPVKFFKSMGRAMEVAFTTSSSAATLPVTMDVVEKDFKVPKSISSFVLPLGATINMDGTAIMQGVAAIFISQLYGIPLGLEQQLMIILTATLASVGTAAVPGAGLIMLTLVLQTVGLPVEGIAIVLGVDRLLDMSRTATNITGDACVAVIVAKGEKGKEEEETTTAA